jgi:phosphotriesterase-related protein
MTVLGPVSPDALGFTLMHEHLFLDARPAYFDDSRPADDPSVTTRLDMSLLGELRWNPGAYADNLVIEDFNTVLEEVAAFRSAGGMTIVDMTTVGLSPRPSDVAEVARRTKVNVVHGCGFYLDRTHPSWVAEASVERLEDFLLSQLEEGFEDTGVRPGIIGEIGTSHPPTDNECKVVRAAARAASRSGVSLNIHLDQYAEDAVLILDEIEGAGHDPARTIFSHLDLHLNVDYHLEVLRRGVIGSYDCFGAETYNGGNIDARDPSDHERVQALVRLVDAGFEDALVLSHDVYTKQQQQAFGGMGFAHLPLRIMPVLRERLGDEICQKLTVGTPRRLLTISGVIA